MNTDFKWRIAAVQTVVFVAFCVSMTADYITILIPQYVPFLLFYCFWCIFFWISVVLIQGLFCTQLFPYTKARWSSYLKHTGLAIIWSFSTVIGITFVKGLLLSRLGAFYSFSSPFGLFMTLDVLTLPNELVWAFRVAHVFSAVLTTICLYALSRSLFAYFYDYEGTKSSRSQ